MKYERGKYMLYKLSEELKSEIKYKYYEDNLVLFAGAGLSIPFQIGNWKELIEKASIMCGVNNEVFSQIQGRLKNYKYNEAVEILKQDIQKNSPEEDAEVLIQNKVAEQIAERQSNLFEYEDAYMPYEKEFCPSVPVSEHNYLDIANYTGFRLMLTTNYDTILSTYTGASSYSILDAPMIEKSGMQHIFIKDNGRYVFHLHGIYTKPESIVLSDESYEKLYQDEAYKSLMELFNGTKSIFYIGFSLDDIYVKTMLLKDIKRFKGKHYIMLAFDGEKARKECITKIKEFKKNNIIVIPYYPHYPNMSVTYAQAIKTTLYDILGLPYLDLNHQLRHWLDSSQRFYSNYVLENLYSEIFHDLLEKQSGTIYKSVESEHETENSLVYYLKKMWGTGVYIPILIKGKGGSGKTVAFQVACQELLKDKVSAIYIPLCDLKKESIEEYIKNRILYTPMLSQKEILWEILQKKCMGLVNGIPQVILFLDGVNELFCEQEYMTSLRRELNNWMCKDFLGVQIVFSSRNDLEDSGIQCKYRCLEVLPLEDMQIENLFDRLKHPLPPKNNKIWKLIKNPLMLSLFLYTEMFAKTFQYKENIFGRWIIDDEPNTTQIIHNFILSQMYKNYRYFDINNAASWYYSIEYGAAKIGWELYNNDILYAEDLQLALYLEEIEDEGWIVDRQMERLRLWCRQEKGWKPDVFSQIQILSNEMGMLYINDIVEEKNYGYSELTLGFTHQIIRDYFAAKALWNDWLNGNMCFKERWCSRSLKQDVLEFLGEMLKDTQWMEVWDEYGKQNKLKWEKSHRYLDETGNYIEYNLFCLSQYIPNFEYDKIRFTWHDLRNIPLFQWDWINQKRNIDFSGSLVSRKTFFTLGHTSYIYIAKVSPNGEYLLTVSADQTMILWDTQKLIPLLTYIEGDYDVDEIAWCPDSSSFLSWGNDKRIIYWETMQAVGRCIFCASEMLSGSCVQWNGNSECIVYDNTALISVGLDGKYRLITKFESAIKVSFSGKGNYLGVIQKDVYKIYKICQLDCPPIQKKCEGTETSDIVFAPNEEDFIFYNASHIDVYRKDRWFSVRLKNIKDIVWSVDGCYFYINTSECLKRYNLKNLKIIKKYEQIKDFEIFSVFLDGKSILIGKGTNLYVYDEQNSSLIKQFIGEDRRVKQLFVDYIERSIITVTLNKVKHWKQNEYGFHVTEEKNVMHPLQLESMNNSDRIQLSSANGSKILIFDGKWSIIKYNGKEKIYLQYIDGNMFDECLYTVQWDIEGNAVVGVDWNYNYYIWDSNSGIVLQSGIMTNKDLELIESIVPGKNNESVFINMQDGSLWFGQYGQFKKIQDINAFGYLQSFDKNVFISKNCNYTTLRLHENKTGKIFEELISIDSLTILGAIFHNTDFGNDKELMKWVRINGGVI